jgi:hypothetical protein
MVRQEWHAQSPNAEILEPASKQEGRSTSADIMKIGTKNVEVIDLGKGPIIIDNPAKSSGVVAAVQSGSAANDHEVSTSSTKKFDPKYTQPRWCPPGLSKTKKRRLQRMRIQQKEGKREKYRDEFFNLFWPVINPKQVWKPKIDEKQQHLHLFQQLLIQFRKCLKLFPPHPCHLQHLLHHKHQYLP